MANTTSSAYLRSQLWEKELFADVMRNLFFNNRSMIGTGMNNIVQVKEDLTKQKGDRITFGLGARLSGSGVTGDNELEGNEEAINYYYDVVLIDQIRQAVRLQGNLDEQKAAYDCREEAKEKGSIWLAEFIERQIFMKLGGVGTTTLTDVASSTYSANAAWSNTPDAVPAAHEAAGTGARYICACSTGIDAIAATDTLTTTIITKAAVKAKIANPRIMPIRVDGQDFYVMFIHPWQAADLKVSTAWAQAQREANIRGDKNPIFSGALGVWDGVIIHEHEFVPTGATSTIFATGGTTTNARVFRSLLCGQQACLMANASNRGRGVVPTFMVEETFDYQNKVGYAVGYMGGIQKATFNSKDYAVISVDTGATDLS